MVDTLIRQLLVDNKRQCVIYRVDRRSIKMDQQKVKNKWAQKMRAIPSEKRKKAVIKNLEKARKKRWEGHQKIIKNKLDTISNV